MSAHGSDHRFYQVMQQIKAAHSDCPGTLKWTEYTLLPMTTRTDSVAVYQCPVCRRRVYIEAPPDRGIV